MMAIHRIQSNPRLEKLVGRVDSKKNHRQTPAAFNLARKGAPLLMSAKLHSANSLQKLVIAARRPEREESPGCRSVAARIGLLSRKEGVGLTMHGGQARAASRNVRSGSGQQGSDLAQLSARVANGGHAGGAPRIAPAHDKGNPRRGLLLGLPPVILLQNLPGAGERVPFAMEEPL